MNNVDLIVLEQKRQDFLKKYGLDEFSIEEFKNTIKIVSKEESYKLGQELNELISKKNYNEETDFDKAFELVKNGADIEFEDVRKGNFPLLICSRKNYLKTFLLLLKAGVNINQSNDYETTSTMGSARHGNKEILQILILMGADINARCLDGDNALMSAKRHDQTECFDMLVKASAHLNNRNIEDYTVLDLKSNKEFDLSLFPSYMVTKNEKQISYEDTNNIIEEAAKRMEKINLPPKNIEMLNIEEKKVHKRTLFKKRKHQNKSKFSTIDLIDYL